ncbi:hypothetical protein, partial [Listeria monocytogenes]|uniref:hypothetical protein n=1 Tax=Listeria monocytogenes TaxID=1639 RepID=UPI003FA43930
KKSFKEQEGKQVTLQRKKISQPALLFFQLDEQMCQTKALLLRGKLLWFICSDFKIRYLNWCKNLPVEVS